MSKKKAPAPEWLSDEMALIGNGIIVSLASNENPFKGSLKPTSPRPKPDSGEAGIIAFWGDENVFPQDVIAKANDDLEVLPLLDKKGRLLQGREVIAINLRFDEEKKDLVTERIPDVEINSFLKGRIFKRYWREACVDFTWFHQIFPDIIKSETDKIAYLGTHEAAWCRWGIMNDKGTIERCFVAADWSTSKTSDKEKVSDYLVLDPYSYSVVDDFRTSTEKRAVYAVNYPTPGSAYYPNAPWTKYLFSKWYELKSMIPIWKATTMQKILSARYVLTIPLTYWPQAYPEWLTLTPEQRKQIKRDKVKEINDSLTGITNAGTTILTEVGYDHEGKEIPGFKITAIDSTFKEGQYNEDSQEASEYLMRSLDLDPTIVGKGPGRGKDAGSGSDKRVAFNILVALLQPYRDIILEPLEFVAEYNGWKEKYPMLSFQVLEVQLETLDKAHQTAVVTNPVTAKPIDNVD